CIYDSRDEIKDILEKYKKHNVSNVLALRGDPPKDNPMWKPKENNFKFSYELVEFIRENHGDDFSIGVAGFPEGHPMCKNKELDAQYLKQKIDAGSDYVITQLFFDNDEYYNYVERLKKLNINARIIPGIFPITDYEGLQRLCQNCGTKIPDNVNKIFSDIKNDKEAVIEAGIQFATNQCIDLLKNGAPGLHFYTLNKIYPTSIILNAIKTELGIE
ncbi:MAG: methylenetetrahydrofolate reductase, partial [Bacteroidales bacterium]|nr:methylenetetrahydrofolate reductase [Bacteroidales bacterium]